MDRDLLLYRLQRKWWPMCTPCSPQDNMFTLMSNCCTWFSKIQEPIRRMTILVVGLDKAGKTSTIRGMLRVSNAVEGGPTQGCVRSSLRLENYLVTLLDVGGSAAAQGSWREHYGEAHGVIFVVDSSDRPRMKEVKIVLADLLKQPRVAGKPILVLANKQDKMNALLGSELIEMLSLEKLVNQSRSLCHIEPCSALMDVRRWSDRKALRGLRWLLRAVCLDYGELCARVAQDSKTPLEPRERNSKAEKPRRSKSERRTSKADLRQAHRPKDKRNMTTGEAKLQPIRNILQKENTLKKKLKKSTRRKKRLTKTKQEEEATNEQEGEEADRGDQEKASSALIPSSKGRPKQKGKVKEETLDVPESPHIDENPLKVKERKRKKKVVRVKRKNKINTEGTSGASSQPVDLSTTFDLYRKAILALKERQDQ
ncbi:ADP-ribosylation factor-like protein 13A isoform X2 [Corythoichthys intestinalis]|uniref:ADP-ribosylation factor-like protein 13A isoform X2 n=1 Tax=Corythoichthys intestinalis TaxID=161448 RepID=UPI0025A65584|nr:ADP-ribosylation factor-like protein 13A isoform X2 [Corythoichthys intestinalis]XP_061793613.1 ADP-ribosylation factor-like protein 13A [Nerophis lumbriciformis]